jgi:hypothetical protein
VTLYHPDNYRENYQTKFSIYLSANPNNSWA